MFSAHVMRMMQSTAEYVPRVSSDICVHKCRGITYLDFLSVQSDELSRYQSCKLALLD